MSKYKVGDKVYFASASTNCITEYLITEIIDKDKVYIKTNSEISEIIKASVKWLDSMYGITEREAIIKSMERTADYISMYATELIIYQKMLTLINNEEVGNE